MRTPSTTASDFDSCRANSVCDRPVALSFQPRIRRTATIALFLLAAALLFVPAASAATKYQLAGQFPPYFPDPLSQCYEKSIG